MIKLKRLSYQIIVRFLIPAILLSVIPISAFAEDIDTEDMHLNVTSVNPLYADVITESELLKAAEVPAPRAALSTYYTNVSDAGAYLREGMKSRASTITIGYKTDTLDDLSQEMMDAIFSAAVMHTGVPTEGDYLLWQYAGWDVDAYASHFNGKYLITFTYAITYYTTASQEDALSAAVESLLASLNLSGMSDYEKVNAIYNYICDNITYDHSNQNDPSYKLKYTAYAALINKTAVCQGYGMLLYRLLLELGIDCRFISGSTPSGNHGWNIVKLGDYYYNLDATWDADLSSRDNFLKCDANFTAHTRDSQYGTDTFYAAYPMSPIDYLHSSDEKPSDFTAIAIPAKPYQILNVVSGVQIYWAAVDSAEKYGVWRSETGKDGTYKWLGNPASTHFTDTNVESGKTYYYRITAMLNGQHTAKSEALGITYISTPAIISRNNTLSGVQLGWNRVFGATGYAIYRKSYSGTDAWVRIATIEDNETCIWTDTSVKNCNGQIYKYTIRALAGSNMKTLSGCYTAGRTMIRLSSQVLTSAVKTKNTSIQCKWTTSSHVTGYEIRFLEDGNIYKTYTISNYKTGVKTFTDLTPGKTYTIQMRTYRILDGVGIFYSEWSAAKEVTL